MHISFGKTTQSNWIYIENKQNDMAGLTIQQIFPHADQK